MKDELMKKLEKMSKADLIQDLWQYRTWFDSLEPEIQFFAKKLYSMFRVVRRDYKGFFGVLLGTRWKLDEIMIGTEERMYDPMKDNYIIETKVMKIPVSMVVNVEFIDKREVEQKKEEPQSLNIE